MTPRRGFLLAAGFGTRLRPLTHHRPKPLAPVCGIPMLDHAAALLQQHGIHSAVVNAHHLPEQIVAWAEQHPMDLHVSVELPDILGTGGGLLKALPQLAERFVVVNGDILSDVDLQALFTALEGRAAAMALRTLDPDQSHGQVVADEAGVVCDLVRLATAEPRGALQVGTHFTGVHALTRAMVQQLPPGESCIVRQAYVNEVPRRSVAATLHRGTWFDVGTPQAYLQANLLAVEGRLRLPLDPFERAAYARRGDQETGTRPAASVEGAVWIGPDVEFEPGVRVGPRAVIGGKAFIGAGADLQDTVVWDGAVVPAGSRLRNAIVYDGGTLTLGGAPTGAG